jgi:hypothetical protein
MLDRTGESDAGARGTGLLSGSGDGGSGRADSMSSVNS